jgi:hypothetical protein
MTKPTDKKLIAASYYCPTCGHRCKGSKVDEWLEGQPMCKRGHEMLIPMHIEVNPEDVDTMPELATPQGKVHTAIAPTPKLEYTKMEIPAEGEE